MIVAGRTKTAPQGPKFEGMSGQKLTFSTCYDGVVRGLIEKFLIMRTKDRPMSAVRALMAFLYQNRHSLGLRVGPDKIGPRRRSDGFSGQARGSNLPDKKCPKRLILYSNIY